MAQTASVAPGESRRPETRRPGTRRPESRRPESRRPARSVSAVVCLVLAAVLTVPAAFAYWAQRTINDGQRYVSTVGPLVDSPQVQAAITTKVTDAIESQVDIEALLQQVFSNVIESRPRLEALVGPVAGAVDGLIENQVGAFVASDAFADFWTAANTRAQEALVRVLKGEETGALSLQGGALVLDLSDVIAQVKQHLIDRGLTILRNVPELPAANRGIVLLEAPQVDQARTIYAFANPVARWLLGVVAMLYLAAFVLSRRRPRMTIIIGALLAASSLLVALLLSVSRQLFVNQLSGTVFGPASTVFFNQLFSYLERGQRVLVWTGLTLVLVGWFAGHTRLGTAVRSTLSKGLESVGSSLRDSSAAGAGRWTAANAGWLRVVVGVLGVVALTWGNQVSMGRFLAAALIVIVLLAAVQVLVGLGRAGDQGGREHEDDAGPEAQGDPEAPTDGEELADREGVAEAVRPRSPATSSRSSGVAP
jgi:hypothetical protein